MSSLKDIFYLKTKKLLPNVYSRDGSSFAGSDNRSTFLKNLQTQPIDWKYRTKNIHYNCNSQLYRAPEWSTIDWANSIVILGCSYVYGIGLAEDETISFQLEKLLNRPVINLGASGTGPVFAMQNSVLLNMHFPTPFAVINIWSEPSRIHEFVGEGDKIRKYGPSFMLSKNNILFKHWNMSENNAYLHSYFAIDATRAIWKEKTRYQSYSFWTPIDESTIFLENDTSAPARDFLHIGSTTAENTAKIIANTLTLN